MTRFDIFNGDADGLCARHQLRLADPQETVLITGVKRDTKLVEQVQATAGDHLTVLDIGFAQNRDGVLHALEAGASCLYFDHHFEGEALQHPALRKFIRTDADVCTSLLVDEYLGGHHELWALCAAFGDGLTAVADRRCHARGLPVDDIRLLRELGEALNYNAYGDTLEDLHFEPVALCRALTPYTDPRAFARESPVFGRLRQGYLADMAQAQDQPALLSSARHLALALPDTAWARRVNGVLANHLAESAPERAHAVLVRRGEAYLVSVRAPRTTPQGADVLCRQFPTGGGRTGAAGINRLPAEEVGKFLTAFEAAFE